MKQRKNLFILAGLSILSLSACDSAKKEMGLTRHSPDAFAVVKRAPLEMPPDYTLRPPQPGAQRPQETRTAIQAQSTVFGSAEQYQAAPGSAEAALLGQAGATAAEPDIRQRIDSETAALEPKDKPVAEKLLGWTRGSREESATVVDAAAEAERLKKNAAEGKPVTEGETPQIEQ